MASPVQTPNNWSIKAIPMAFGLGLVPHLYYTSRLMLASNGKMSNAMQVSRFERPVAQS